MATGTSTTITQVVTKYVLPTVMQTLIAASQALVNDQQATGNDGGSPADIINDTSSYINEKFNLRFGYLYDAQASVPTNMISTETGVLLGMSEFVGFYQNDQDQMLGYIDSQFSNAIFPNSLDSRLITKLSTDFYNLINSQMSQGSDSWVPFNNTKMYQLISDPTKTVEVDMMVVMFTASDEESVDPTKPAAFINYALVAYYTTV